MDSYLGYTCGSCGMWVQSGWLHQCGALPVAPAPVPVTYYVTDPRLTATLDRLAAALERIEKLLSERQD